MAYAFNNDRSKTPVYTKDEVDQMKGNIVLDFNEATCSGEPDWEYTFEYITNREVFDAVEAGCNVIATWVFHYPDSDDYLMHYSPHTDYTKQVINGNFFARVDFDGLVSNSGLEVYLEAPYTQEELDAALDAHPVLTIVL